MRLSAKIWKELGALAQHVEMIDHDNGTARYKPGTSPAEIAACNAVIAAHDAEAPDKDALRKDADRVRDAKLSDGVTFAGRRWQMDDVMRSALQWRITRWQLGRLAADATLPVRAMDNTIQMLGRDEHIALAEAIEAAGGAIYAESWAVKDAL